MAVSPSQIDDNRTLASILVEQRILAVPAALALVRKLAQQTAELHARGMICGTIIPALVLLDEDLGPHLAPAASGSHLALEGDWASLLPELARLEPLPLPATVGAVKTWLQAGGVTLDPRQIDLCQLGALWCQLLTGEAPGAYLRSPRVKGLVPAELQLILERALGSGGSERFADAQELVVALNAAAEQFAPPPTISGTEGAAADARQVGAPTPAHVTSDTTPSFVSSENQPGDTSIAGKHGAAARSENAAALAGEDPLPFARLGHYKIERRIGRGGMGDVYLGYEPALDRKVAIKVLPADMARSDEFVRRFRTEATAVAKLNHPNIVPIHFIGEDQGHHFYAMQFVEGESLAEHLVRQERLGVAETLRIVEQVLAGLAAAHHHGMVHRDIKPGNILLDRGSGRALLADFGLVKSLESSATGKTATGVIMGTADYISPEQGRGQTVDHRSDLYSIGVLLYRMLSGQLPFTADSPTALIFQHVYEHPPELMTIVPDVPDSLAQVVARLLAKSPADRHQSAEVLLADLAAIRTGQPVPPSSRSASEPAATIIRLSAFDAEPAQLPADLAGLEPPKWLDQVRGRALSMFRRHAPEVLQQLQNTQQQVDGAISVYERRLRELQKLAATAESVLEDLQTQERAQRTGAQAAEERARVAETPASQARARDEAAACNDAAAELERQIADQQEQLDPIRLALAKAQARVQELRNQRDIFNARLKAAGAQAHVVGRRAPKRRWVLAGSVATVVGLVLAGTVIWLNDRAPSTAISKGPAAAGADPSGVNDTDSVPATSMTAASTQESGSYPLPGMVTGLRSEIKALAFAPARQPNGLVGFAAAGVDGTVTIFQINNAAQRIDRLGQLPGHLKPVAAVAYSPDTTRLAAASDDGTVSIWDRASKREIRRLQGHQKPVKEVLFSADGSRLLTAGMDGFVRLWDIQSEVELQQVKLSVYREWPDALAWAPDGNRVFVGARTHGAESSCLINLNSGAEQFPFQDVKTPVMNGAFTRDGLRVVGIVRGGKESFVVWDAQTGSRLTAFGTGFHLADLTPDGSRALTADDKRNLQVWDTSAGMVTQNLPGAQERITAIAISADGMLGLTAGINPMTGMDPTIKLWELDRPALPRHQLHAFDSGGPVECVAFSPDGSLGASGDGAKVHVWNLEKPDQSYAYDLNIPVAAVVFSPTGDRIAFATGQPNSSTNSIRLRIQSADGNLRFREGNRDLRRFEIPAQRYAGAAFVNQARQLLTANIDGTLRVWDVQTEKNVATTDFKLAINAVATVPGSDNVVVATDDKDLIVWDWKANAETGRLKGHSLRVNCVAVSAGGQFAVSSGSDRSLRVWKMADRESRAVLTGNGSPVNAVAISSDGKRVLAAGDDGDVRVWNVETATTELRFSGHSGPVKTVALAPDETRVLSGGTDGTVRLWSLGAADTASTSEN